MPLKTPFPHWAGSYGLDRLTTGEVYFVDSGATGVSDGNLGDSPERPLATLNGAITRATASNGDMIVLMPGHAENCSSATTQVISKAGLSIVGVGRGSSRPTFTFTDTAGSFEIDSADTLIENVLFMAGISAVVVGVNVDANYVTLKNCEWNFSTTAFDFVIMVDVDDVDHCTIEDCLFRAEAATAGADHAIRIDTADWFRCINNEITGDYAAGPITGEDAASTQILIQGNKIYNDDTAFAENGIDLNVACTGMILDNRITTLQAADVHSLLDPGSCLCLQNYAGNAVDEHGLLTPTTAAT